MRKFSSALAAALVLAGYASAWHVASAVSQSAVQVLFLGDRECGDDATTCVFPSIVPEHRYLHVILHDDPGNEDWRVQAAPRCSDAMPDTVGGVAAGSGGYLEAVADLSVTSGLTPGSAICFVFRGRNRYWVTYYAAYLDDTGTLDASSVYPRYQLMAGRPDLPDLDVLLIHRSPSYAYDASKNAPSLGEMVTFTAEVANVGGEPAPGFGYQWMLDGDIIAAGSYPLGLRVGEKTDFSLPWTWEARSHDLEFQVIPAGDEITNANDALTVRTNAITLGFWIEQSAFDFFQAHQWLYCSTLPCAGSDSFADWLQRQVSTWNRMFQDAAYPGLDPAGIADRVRVDEITIVPDGALPLHGGLASNSPDRTDHTVDLEWGVASAVVKGTYHVHWENPFDVDWGMLHELGHARYLADLYRYDIPLSGSYAFNIAPLSGDAIVTASRSLQLANQLQAFDAGQNQLFFYQNEDTNDLMTCVCSHGYSAYTAVVLNRIRGRRARCGNVNPPCNLGEWFLEMPPVNRVRVIDETGAPLPDGTVIKQYFDMGESYTAHAFDRTHSEAMNVSHGTITLDSDPVHSGGSVSAAGRNLLLLQIPSAHGETLCFVEPTVLNIAYWLGYRNAAHPAVYRLRLGTQVHNDCTLQLPTARVNEPFATSPDASVVRFGPVTSSSRKKVREVVVSLRDDAKPANAMWNREVRLERSDGRVLGSGITSGNGIVRIRVDGGVKRLVVNDVTDDNLRWAAVAGR